ncbi:transcriptional regulator ATRX homolog isoform X2 [Diachasma alloeum]|uniref:transcriptional regulator ATRX homolog isoform X2 n=1 Tax=Diachasma alloeum TaxID=454923 RepID=UPI0007382018|nr:transcriptional regulator ATRX homolog isoform X2 [Diachasma alloeum]
MVTRRKTRSSDAEESRNSAVDDETAISQTERQRGSGSPGGVDVTVRRSTRTRKEPAKYQSPCPSPTSSKRSGSSKTSVSSQSDQPVSSQSEDDSGEVEVKKRKTSKKGKKGKTRTTRPTKKKQTGSKMTEYERMIQKNIQERNAFLENLMKGEGNSFEEEKPVKTSRKKKRRASSTNDEEEIQQPKKRRKVATRKRKASSDDDEEEETGVSYNTRSRGAKRPRGIYKEHGSSGGENDTLSSAADVSDNEDEETRGKRKTRSYKKTESAIVTRGLAMLAQKREELKVNQHPQDPEHIGEASGEAGDGEEDVEDNDKRDEDYVEDSCSTEEEGTFVDGDDTEGNSDGSNPSPKENVGMGGEGGGSDEGRDPDAAGRSDLEAPGETPVDEKGNQEAGGGNEIINPTKDDGKVPGKGDSPKKQDADGEGSPRTPEWKENGSVDETEGQVTPKIRKVRSEEFLEENKENSMPEEPQDVLSPGK